MTPADVKPRILVVEDDAKTVGLLTRGLGEQGFAVSPATTGPLGLILGQTGSYDLIILDIMLPELDGWAVYRQLRAGGITTPILFLTARDGVSDRVQGLELGADDYLIKPFALAELVARIRRILRQGSGRSPEMVRIADLEVDLARQKASRGGAPLELTPKEFVLLALLARRAGEVQSRAAITAHVWDVNVDHDTNVVDVHVRRLRAKADDPFERKLIHSVRGVGYVLEARD